MRRLLFLALVFCQSWVLAPSAHASERIALVFGNTSYRNAPRLPNPVNDATDVAAALTRLGFSVNLVQNGTFDAMRRGLLDLAQQASTADIVVVYYAGHGMEMRDENWLIPVDAELRASSSASQELISLAGILPVVSSARKLGLIMLDACRDNPFSRQQQMSGRALTARGLVSVEPPNSVLVVFAAKHGTTADDGAGRNSPFTKALLNNIEIPGLELNYLFRNVRDEVYSATARRQEPYVYGTLSKEPIYLKQPAAGSGTASEAAQTWQSVKETNRPEVLKKFIEIYGATIYGELARERLTNIEASASELAKAPALQVAATPEIPAATPAAASTPALPTALPTNLAALAGHWSWRASCGILGTYSGTVEYEVLPDGRFVGRRSNGEVLQGRISGNTVVAQMKVDGGVQKGRAILTLAANGHHRLEGSFTDSRIPVGSCPYSQNK